MRVLPLVLLASVVVGCDRPPASPVPRAADNAAAPRQVPVAGLPSASVTPPQQLARPVVLRCPTPTNGCHFIVRVRFEDGGIESLQLHPFINSYQGMPIVVDSNHVFWPGRALRKKDLSPFELNWPCRSVQGLGQDDHNLVVVCDGKAYLMPKDGSPARRLVDDSRKVWSAATSKSQAAWTIDESGVGPRGKVVVATLDGQVIETWSNESHPFDVKAFDGQLFWINFGHTGPENPTGAIRTLRDGGPVTLAGGQYVPRDLTVDSGFVYWVTDEHEGRFVRRVPVGGGKIETLGVSYELEGHRGNSDRIVVRNRYVYWNAAHSVVRIPVEGGTPSIVVTASIPGDIVSFDVDDTHAYVTAMVYPIEPPG